MLQILVQIFTACLGLMMFWVDRKHKLAILLFAALCLTCVQLPLPFAKDPFGFLPLCFLLSELKHWRSHYTEMRATAIWWLMLLMMLSAFVYALNSPHCDTLILKAKLVYSELMQKTFILAFVMFCIWDERDLKPAVRYAFIGLIILTALGVVNYFTKQSFWVTSLRGENLGLDAGSVYEDAERFRVQSMFGLAFDYGYTCILFAIFFFYALLKKLIAKHNFLIAELCCLYGVYFCGCRSVHVCYLLAVVVYSICLYDIRRWLRGALVVVVISLIFLPMIPGFEEYLELFLNALSIDSNELTQGGSSIGMRLVQLTTVIYYIQSNLLFGMGKDYFNIDLGWADKVEGGKAVDSDLFGLEGVYLSYLLERGIFGYLCYLIFYVSLFITTWKLRHSDPETFALFAAVIAAYFFYANATGELQSVAPTMLMMGIGLKMLYVKSGKLIRRTRNDKAFEEDSESRC